MNASFGIDHPLLATRDIGALRNRLIALGFTMTAIGQHPWGTSTSLAMFDGCLLEIMGIYDDSLLDEVPAGAFRFGRHIHAYLQKREGVALSAEERAARAKAAAEEVVCVCVCVCVCPCVSVCVRVSVFASLLTQECTRVVHKKKTGTIHI